jgi:membrane protein
LVFEPLIVTNAVTYGALGTVLIVQSWLIGVGWVVYGGQLTGRWFHDAWLRAWADNRWGRSRRLTDSTSCARHERSCPADEQAPDRP